MTLEQDSRVVLVSPATAWARVQELGTAAKPRGSVVGELLLERRAEARREDTGDAVDDLFGG